MVGGGGGVFPVFVYCDMVVVGFTFVPPTSINVSRLGNQFTLQKLCLQKKFRIYGINEHLHYWYIARRFISLILLQTYRILSPSFYYRPIEFYLPHFITDL